MDKLDTQQLIRLTEIDQRYDDFIGPLMPYCIEFTPERVLFRLPMNLLSGPANVEFLNALFDRFDVTKDVKTDPLKSYQYGFDFKVVGNIKTVALYFRKELMKQLGFNKPEAP